MVETKIPLVENVEHPRMEALKYLYALQKRVEEIEELMEHVLIYVEAWINHKAVRNTIVDSEVTHNFMTETEAKHLNIFSHRDTRKMKAVNYAILPILGVAKRTLIKLEI